MSSISVLMVVYNEEDTISEAMKSVLIQSFSDFELIIVDDGSTDNTHEIIKSFKDKRIRFIKSDHDFVKSLNIGLYASSGKYIAGMTGNDIMHIDRLKIQYSILEEFQKVTVCCCMEMIYGDTMPVRIAKEQMIGLIELPLLELLMNDSLINSACFFICRSFVLANSIRFENYPFAENYKFLVETARRNGVFYIESQPLIYRRVSDANLLRKVRTKKLQYINKIKMEVINSLCSINKIAFPALTSLYQSYYELSEQKLILENEISKHFCDLFMINKDKLIIKDFNH